MLRITVLEASSNTVMLRLEGRIAGPWVEELRTTCNVHAGPDSVRLYLNLEEVCFADPAGVAFLKELREKGVALSHVPPLLAELFKNDLSPEET